MGPAKEVCSELLLHHPPSEPWQPEALNEALFFIAGWRILFLADGSLPGAAGQLHIQGMEVHYVKAGKNLIFSVLGKESPSSLNLKRDEADKSIADPQFEIWSFRKPIQSALGSQQTFILQLAGIFFDWSCHYCLDVKPKVKLNTFLNKERIHFCSTIMTKPKATQYRQYSNYLDITNATSCIFLWSAIVRL